MLTGKLYARTCICGCGLRFLSSLKSDLYASEACRKLHVRERLLTLAELALRLDVTPSTVSRWIKRSVISYSKSPDGLYMFEYTRVLSQLEKFQLPKKKAA